MFRRILIANRGEIACRIEQTCRRLGIQTVAIGSTADEHALHMKQADQAVVIGPSEAKQSYLNDEIILKTALQFEAEAIHPGYGFLSENAEFAEHVRRAGLVFIGPPTKAIQVLGSKTQAKALARSVKVPIVPGYEGTQDLEKIAHQFGFPLLIKAIYGGGGKGMRLVTSYDDLESALAACRREAEKAFGNNHVMLEKYIERPRHIEVQILSDSYGQCMALSDRDCSLQRRYQKVIEEAPAPHLPQKLRYQLHDSAVRIAQTIGYEGAGTVEFLVDHQGDYFFMEMNTRLQVEHPVTEMVLGLDLVEWQIRIAAGEKLTLSKKQMRPYGHAMEARVYAEDGYHHFLPSPGTITHFRLPAEDHVRVDTGVREGDEVTLYYDPMIAKVIAWGNDRHEALKRLQEALSHTEVGGVKTNLNFLKLLLWHPEIVEGTPSIDFIDSYLKPQSVPNKIYLLAALYLYQQRISTVSTSPWLQKDGWRLNAPMAGHVFSFKDKKKVSVMPLRRGVHIHDEEKTYRATDILLDDTPEFLAVIDGHSYKTQIMCQGNDMRIQWGTSLYEVHQEETRFLETTKLTESNRLIAPMPGRVISVMVHQGEVVAAGQPLLILEAMKMEHTIQAPYAGIVDHLPFASGDFCEEGIELVRLRQE